MLLSMIGLLIFLTVLVFSLLLPKGTNVPYERRPYVVGGLVLLNILIQIATQSIDFQINPFITHILNKTAAASPSAVLPYLDTLALTPSKLHAEGGWRWMQLLTANFLHAGWVHLVLNLWFFIIFAINLEDLFGHAKFLFFIVLAMVTSQLSVAYLTVGTEAYNLPHAGFSGIVYATAAAYMVCYPRSRVRVVLIHDIKFWIFALFLVPAMLAPFRFVLASQSTAQLLQLLLCVFLYAYMQPDHEIYGVPASVFIGYWFVFNVLPLNAEAEQQGISVWSHAGGLLAGLSAGLALNGTKGFYKSWDEPEIQRRVSRREAQLQAEKELHKLALSSETAAHKYLSRRVLAADAEAAVQFYIETVVTNYPQLVLDPNLQLALARMLERQGQLELALRAYDMLLQHHPDAQGVELAYMAAAELCKNFNERLVDGIAYLDKFDEFPSVLVRDRLLAKRLREELVELAQRNQIELPESAQRPAARPPSKENSDDLLDHWQRKLPFGAASGGTGIGSRIQKIETINSAPAPAPESSALDGKKPLELKFIKDSAPKDDPEEDFAPPPIEISLSGPVEASPLLELTPPSPPAEEPQPAAPPVADACKLKPEVEIAVPLADPVSSTPQPQPPAREEMPYLAALVGNEPARPDEQQPKFVETERPSKRPQEPPACEPAESFSILLSSASPIRTDALLSFLLKRSANAAEAKSKLLEGKGLLLRRLTRQEASLACEELAALGVAASAVAENHPALVGEPFEARSIRITPNELTLTGYSERRRAAFADVELLNFAKVKLSSRSTAYKACIDLLLRGFPRRIQLWERTLVATSCSIDEAPLNPDTPPLEQLFAALSSRALPDSLAPAARRAQNSPDGVPCFDSYTAYENYVAFCILSRSNQGD